MIWVFCRAEDGVFCIFKKAAIISVSIDSVYIILLVWIPANFLNMDTLIFKRCLVSGSCIAAYNLATKAQMAA